MKKRKANRQPKALMLAVPEFVEARELYSIIRDAMDKLAELSRTELANQEQEISVRGVTWRSKKQYAANYFAALPGVFTLKVAEVLATAKLDEPCKLADILLASVTDGVKTLEGAMKLRSKQFAKFARRQFALPTLRSVSDNGETFRQL